MTGAQGPRRIFIGGTGRSGTTLLYRILGGHPEVHAFPLEMRFLIDPDGLLDLVDALTSRFSPVRAREALYRFERLLRVHLATPRRRPYHPFDFPGLFGLPEFHGRLDAFLDELTVTHFEGTDWQIVPEDEGRLVAWARALQGIKQRLLGRPVVPMRPTLSRGHLAVARDFTEREQLVRLAAVFVDDLFTTAARRHGKRTWCEKTPHNLLHLDFLWELFPDCVFVHVKRDPRGVVLSLQRQFWAPDDLDGACDYLAGVYRRWLALRQTLRLEAASYVEIKLEDLVDGPGPILADLVGRCRLATDFGELPAIDPERAGTWRQQMSPAEMNRATERLEPYIRAMGYSP